MPLHFLFSFPFPFPRTPFASAHSFTSILLFPQALKTDPAQTPTDGQDIITTYRDILVTAQKVSEEGLDGKQFFGRLPVAGYEVKPVEPFREAHAPPAFYYPPSADGSRGGIFYANTYKYETRGKFVMEVNTCES